MIQYRRSFRLLAASLVGLTLLVLSGCSGSGDTKAGKAADPKKSSELFKP